MQGLLLQEQVQMKQQVPENHAYMKLVQYKKWCRGANRLAMFKQVGRTKRITELVSTSSGSLSGGSRELYALFSNYLQSQGKKRHTPLRMIVDVCCVSVTDVKCTVMKL